MPMASFIDGPPTIRRVVKHLLNGYPVTTPSYWTGLLASVSRVLSNRGLNPGLAFERWLADAFADLGVRDNRALGRDLECIKQQLEAIGVRFDTPNRHDEGDFRSDDDKEPQLLRVVATGLPPGLKLVFPDGLDLLDKKYQLESPAMFVRASMAIPGFFEPKILELDPDAWRSEVKKRLEGLVAKKMIDDISGLGELQLVDGGLLSNVQVDAFETMRRPRNYRRHRPVRTERTVRTQFPTIIATLVKWRQEKHRSRNSIGGVFDDALGLAQAVRLQRDRDAWWRITADGNRDVKIVEIDASRFNWLNFTMSEAEMGRLFLSGLERAEEFLRRDIK
jgi:NTE family protein